MRLTQTHDPDFQDEPYDDDRAGRSAHSREHHRGWLDDEADDDEATTPRAPSRFLRSDAYLQKAVTNAIALNGLIDATEIEVNVHEGEVTLTGSVNTLQAKLDAEALAERITGVLDVHNQIRVLHA